MVASRRDTVTNRLAAYGDVATRGVGLLNPLTAAAPLAVDAITSALGYKSGAEQRNETIKTGAVIDGATTITAKLDTVTLEKKLDEMTAAVKANTTTQANGEGGKPRECKADPGARGRGFESRATPRGPKNRRRTSPRRADTAAGRSIARLASTGGCQTRVASLLEVMVWRGTRG